MHANLSSFALSRAPQVENKLPGPTAQAQFVLSISIYTAIDHDGVASRYFKLMFVECSRNVFKAVASPKIKQPPIEMCPIFIKS